MMLPPPPGYRLLMLPESGIGCYGRYVKPGDRGYLRALREDAACGDESAIAELRRRKKRLRPGRAK